jgi:DNA-binding NtrC family response regulator
MSNGSDSDSSAPTILPQNRKILVVEDENDIREVILECLRPLDIHVDSAENGADALERIRIADYHLVLSDINMPKMNGIELLENVRQIGKKPPFVYLTAYGDKERTLEALRLGVFDFVEKPFHPETLLGVVKRGIEVGVRSANQERIVERLASGQMQLSEKGRQLLKKEAQMIDLFHVANKRSKRTAA